jgi:2-polyprenyl-6-methoxyphenol hydroxylase-like FAD-dependent oxidoreductase
MFAPASDRTITAHLERGDTLHAYISLTRPLTWFQAIDFSDPQAATARIAAEFDGWAPGITALIAESDTPPVLRPHHALPAGHRWQRSPGVTLIGDAAHLQAPDGDGANWAMCDGAELAGALVARLGDVEAGLDAYEQAMFTRMSQADEVTAKHLEETFESSILESPRSLVSDRQKVTHTWTMLIGMPGMAILATVAELNGDVSRRGDLESRCPW